MIVQKIFEVLDMSYIFKMMAVSFVCLFLSTDGFAQEQPKKFLQTIPLDSTIQYVEIKTDESKKKPYHDITWEGTSIIVECKVSVDTETSIGFSFDDYFDDYKINTTQNDNKLVLDLDNARSGVIYVKGERLEVKTSYNILIPKEVVIID